MHNRFVEVYTSPVGKHHKINLELVSTPEHRAKVMGIGDAVKEQYDQFLCLGMIRKEILECLK